MDSPQAMDTMYGGAMRCVVQYREKVLEENCIMREYLFVIAADRDDSIATTELVISLPMALNQPTLRSPSPGFELQHPQQSVINQPPIAMGDGSMESGTQS